VKELVETSIDCPYCGESIDVLLNPDEADQSYVEDWQVCCRPIVFNVMEDVDGDLQVTVRVENE